MNVQLKLKIVIVLLEMNAHVLKSNHIRLFEDKCQTNSTGICLVEDEINVHCLSCQRRIRVISSDPYASGSAALQFFWNGTNNKAELSIYY